MRPGREILVDPSLFQYGEEDLFATVSEECESKVLDVLDALPEPKRSVVEMIAIGRLGKVETARALGLSRQWVQKVWRQAREEIADALQGEEP